MSSGKSTWIFNFLKHMGDVTNIKKLGHLVDIHYCYSTESSLSAMETMCNDNEYIRNFHTYHLLPNINELEAIHVDPNIQRILVFEDLGPFIAGTYQV